MLAVHVSMCIPSVYWSLCACFACVSAISYLNYTNASGIRWSTNVHATFVIKNACDYSIGMVGIKINNNEYYENTKH